MDREHPHRPDFLVVDVLEAFGDREEYEELSELQVEVATLSLLHGYTVDEVLAMTWGDYLELYTTPVERPTVRLPRHGKNRAYYGLAAFPSYGEDET